MRTTKKILGGLILVALGLVLAALPQHAASNSSRSMPGAGLRQSLNAR